LGFSALMMICLQCFDAVGWAAGRASSLYKTEWWGAGMVICLEQTWRTVTSWCHCHSLSLASVKSRLVLPFWYWLTQVVPEKGPSNVCVCVCSDDQEAIWQTALTLVCLSNCLPSAAGPTQSPDPPSATVCLAGQRDLSPVSVNLLSVSENISVLGLVPWHHHLSPLNYFPTFSGSWSDFVTWTTLRFTTDHLMVDLISILVG